jgi:hypothetical protein
MGIQSYEISMGGVGGGGGWQETLYPFWAFQAAWTAIVNTNNRTGTGSKPSKRNLSIFLKCCPKIVLFTNRFFFCISRTGNFLKVTGGCLKYLEIFSFRLSEYFKPNDFIGCQTFLRFSTTLYSVKKKKCRKIHFCCFLCILSWVD